MRTPLASLLALFAATLLAGCQVFDYGGNFNYNVGNPEFRPSAEGPAAVVGAITVIPGLHLAHIGTGAPGAAGPGLARFNGTVLEAFSVDGSLDPAITPSSQPGFFWRATSTFQGYEGSDSAITGSGVSDGVVAVGKWFAGGDRPAFAAGSRDNLISNGVLAYAIGQSTPAAGLPQSGTASYQLSASTWSGQYARASGALSVLWGGSTPKVALDLSLSAIQGRVDYRFLTTGGLENPSLSEISVRAGTATFGGSGIPLTACFGGTCQADVEGFFAGSDAGHAGLVYRLTGRTSFLDDGIGSAAFAFSEFTVPPTPAAPPSGLTLLDQTDPNAFVISFAHSGFAAQPFGPPATAAQSVGGQLESFVTTGGSPGNQVTLGRGTAQSPAAETGGDSLITWGRWTNGTPTGTAAGFPATFGANQGFHYVVGAATPPANIPGTGTATFALMGATKPTFTDGAFAPGTFTGSMAVQWGGAAATKVGVDFNVAMPGDASYRIQSNGGLAAPGTSLISTSGGSTFTGPADVTVTGAGRACPVGCSANLSGFFAGPNAERAGTTYTIGLGGTSIQGAAAFTR